VAINVKMHPRPIIIFLGIEPPGEMKKYDLYISDIKAREKIDVLSFKTFF
jgi:hypothetical protein